MKKITAAILIIAILLGAGLAYILTINLQLKKSIRDLEKKKEDELRVQLKQEREAVQKDLNEKYHVNTVSFEALAKRLEIERNKTKELQEQIKTQKMDGK